jgi:hypothetical protein
MTQEVGIQEGHGSDHPTWSWGPEKPEGLRIKGWWCQQGLDPVQPKRQGMDPAQSYGPPQPEGWGSWWLWCVDLASSCGPVQPEGQRDQQSWVAVFRPKGWRLGRPAVLLLDHGLEKTSMISGFIASLNSSIYGSNWRWNWLNLREQYLFQGSDLHWGQNKWKFIERISDFQESQGNSDYDIQCPALPFHGHLYFSENKIIDQTKNPIL